MEYLIVSEKTATFLPVPVGVNLENGFECVGGPFYGDGFYHQAMIRKKKQKRPSTKFKKPTKREIALYCKERGNSINAADFFDYYEACGWKVGNKTMKDWKACVRTWEKRDRNNNVSAPKSVHRDEEDLF